MKAYIKTKDKRTCEESEFIEGKKITGYFYLICDICGVKYPDERHPDVCVNELCEEDGFPNGDYCWNCQMSMKEQGFVGKDKSHYFCKEYCEQCKEVIRDMNFIQLYYLDKTLLFCSSKCYIKFVKAKHPTTKKEWDKVFNSLTKGQKRIYYDRLRSTKKLVTMLIKKYGHNYHHKGIRHAHIWTRPA